MYQLCQVVQAIATNSATFSSKTKYSKEKYVKKKAKKYDEPVTLHRPSVVLVAEMFFVQCPFKVSLVTCIYSLACNVYTVSLVTYIQSR